MTDFTKTLRPVHRQNPSRPASDGRERGVPQRLWICLKKDVRERRGGERRFQERRDDERRRGERRSQERRDGSRLFSEERRQGDRRVLERRAVDRRAVDRRAQTAFRENAKPVLREGAPRQPGGSRRGLIDDYA